MKSIAFMLFLIAATVLFTSCTGKDDPINLCGEDQHKSIGWDTAVKTFPWNDPTWSTYLDGNTRIFEVRSEVYTDVCPVNEIFIEFDGCVGFLSSENLITMEVQYCYGESGEYGGKEITDVFHFTKYFTFNIADNYGSNPGKFYLYVRWWFHAADDIAADFNYFKEKFSRSNVTISYSHY